MKKVLIIGASGSLAKYVIEELSKQADLKLTLFCRNKNRLSKNIGNAAIIEGDVLDYPKLKISIEGHDIVYVNLAGDLDAMSRNIVKGMKETGVNRIITISSIGIYETPMKPVLKPYRALADIVEGSGLDYTILRPDWFTNGDEIDYHITRKPEPEVGGAISRKSIASFVGKLVANPQLHINENLGISKLN